MGHRGMARVVALFTGKDYASTLNDVYRVTTTDVQQADAVTRVKERLVPCGYYEWLDEE